MYGKQHKNYFSAILMFDFDVNGEQDHDLLSTAVMC